MAKILEEAENPAANFDRIATVETSRGEEVQINVDAAVTRLAELWSSHKREKAEGGALTEFYWRDLAESMLSGVRNI